MVRVEGAPRSAVMPAVLCCALLLVVLSRGAGAGASALSASQVQAGTRQPPQDRWVPVTSASGDVEAPKKRDTGANEKWLNLYAGDRSEVVVSSQPVKIFDGEKPDKGDAEANFLTKEERKLRKTRKAEINDEHKFSSLYSGDRSEVVVSSQALKVNGGEPDAQETADVKLVPRRRISRELASEDNSTPKSIENVSQDGKEKGDKAVLPGHEESPKKRSKEYDYMEDVHEDIGRQDYGDIPDIPGVGDIPGFKGMKKKKKWSKFFKKIMPYMMIPAFMALGYMPFALASLKMFVMNAVTLNMMAFNAAIFLTLRNMVFGPRNGQHVKYWNFGYGHAKAHHHKEPHHPHWKRFTKRN